MPETRQHRTWCKTCQDFKIHTQVPFDTLKCSCGTEFSEYSLLNVPEQKIQEQRIRYSNSQQRKTLGIYSSVMSMSSLKSSYISSEDDAGLKYIIEKRNEKLKEYKEMINTIQREYLTYSKLGRNDKCACNSGKKYKQCHLIYFRQHLNV